VDVYGGVMRSCSSGLSPLDRHFLPHPPPHTPPHPRPHPSPLIIQAIKSSSSSRWHVLLSFACRNRLLLSGTPIQNALQVRVAVVVAQLSSRLGGCSSL
jgi:hypothetical protein